ncbi:DNA starvation/stationary phase protection protein [Gryllotalpicola kribbensis]|uniref:DNA starvation/stationary phase protection protein n=1 Tax=Gryllotalpicola kribbensis TaxID=993084 RepID=A0ABP8AI55_9MICO
MARATASTRSTTRATGAKKPTPREGAARSKKENAENGFVASERLTGDLQRVLVDLIELSLQAKQAHWNVVGKNFRDLHLQLDEITESAREFSDVVAERLRALHAAVDGRSAFVSETTSLPPYPNGEVATSDTVDLITVRLEAVVGTMRDVHDEVDEEDPTTADILHEIISTLEQYAWMVSAENRTPSV